MKKIIQRFFTDFKSPLVSLETQHILHNTREALPDKLKTHNQFVGQQYAGCGATIGVMPRCDFACKGCYLGKEANRISPESVEGIKRQIQVIRDWLGYGGNVQITDGEVTLRPIAELIEIIQYARKIGLVPMLMSHGDAFRKSPELLKRLMLEAGLTELSIHIDSTQRGRSGTAYRYATSEQQLMPLRDEFASLIRKLRKETGKTLEVAMTFTVTDENILAVPSVLYWLKQNADVFKMISFQPVAQVGRTEKQMGESLTVERLWATIGQGLYADKNKARDLTQHYRLFGHPDCTRFIQGVVVTEKNTDPQFYALFKTNDKDAIQLINQWSEYFGGINFRNFSKTQQFYCLLKMLMQQPKFMAFSVLPFVLQQLRLVENRSATQLVIAWLTGRTQIDYLSIVSHHFMNREQIETPLGQERISACVFKVPINGSLVSMCEVNALSYRKDYYQSIDKSGNMDKITTATES